MDGTETESIIGDREKAHVKMEQIKANACYFEHSIGWQLALLYALFTKKDAQSES